MKTKPRTATEQQIASEYQAEIELHLAHLSRICEALRPIYNDYCNDIVIDFDQLKNLFAVYEETPEQSLAMIKGEVYAILYAAREIKRLNSDIEAYRGALGYTVEAGHDGRLSTGVLPFCGLCDAKAEQIRQLEQSNQWVRISDRKPAECESVLACNFHLPEIEADQTYLSDESWVIADGIALSFDTYTHWMPIPKPPVSY